MSVSTHEPDEVTGSTTGAPRTRFLLVVNPNAGIRSSRLVREVVRELRSAGANVEITETPDPAAAHRAASQNHRCDAVIAAGGDGTVRTVHGAFNERDLPLGIIPSGTGNVLATEINMPRRARGIADTLLSGPVAEIDGGLANGAPFFLMAGIGFDGDVISMLDHGLKSRFGKLAYAVPLVRALLRTTRRFEVLIDGVSHEASWIIIAKARHYAGRFVLVPGAGVFRPGLHAVMFKSESRIGRLRELCALATGQLARVPGIEIIPCRNAEIACTQHLPIEADGDYLGNAPLSVTSGGPKLRLIVPPGILTGR